MERPDMTGLIAAIVTPMREDASVDETSLRRYVRWLTDQAITGLAVNVDTGEGPHLSAEERVRVIEVVAEEVGDRTLIVAGLAGSFTAQAARLASDAASAGARALLVFPIPVYQGEPLDPEIPARYHGAVHEASGLPLIAFQLQPALGGVNFSAEVLERLMTVDGVVAIKEASFDARRFVDTARLIADLPRPITLLTGNDNFILESFMLAGKLKEAPQNFTNPIGTGPYRFHEIRSGEKITARKARELSEEGLKEVLVSPDDLSGRYIAEDIVDLDTRFGRLPHHRCLPAPRQRCHCAQCRRQPHSYRCAGCVAAHGGAG